MLIICDYLDTGKSNEGAVAVIFLLILCPKYGWKQFRLANCHEHLDRLPGQACILLLKMSDKANIFSRIGGHTTIS